MQMTFPKNMMVLTTTFALTSMTYAETNVTFVDGFEAPLPYVKTECGFYDKKTKLTWSVKSYECDAFPSDLKPDNDNYNSGGTYNGNSKVISDNLALCVKRANEEVQKEKASCKGRVPFYGELETIIDSSATPKSKLPNAATDGVTVEVPDTTKPICAALSCGHPHGVSFKTGEKTNFYFRLPKKHYVRLVITS